jgi:putative heme-binding domain-containing protein
MQSGRVFQEDRRAFPTMSVSRIRLIVIAFSLLLAGKRVCPQPAGQKASKASQTSSSVAAGRQTFSSICASCHGLDGRGGERGPDIANRPDSTRLTDQDTLKILRDGIPEKGMPPFAALGPRKLSDLLSYLRALQGKGAETPVSGDAQKGKELFSGKGGCSACHMVNGSGGFLGPELSSYGGSHSAEDIREAIVNPKERAGGRNAAAEVTTKDGKSYSGLVRNEDNFSLQLQSSDGAFHFFSKSEVAAIAYRKEPFMPADYGAKLSPAELDALAAYLLQIARAKSRP